MASSHHYGFSLVEMAVVLAIVGLLLAGLLPSISAQMDIKKINETRTQMDEIRAALIGFAVSKGYLPCPDITTPPDGNEDRMEVTPPSDNVPQTGQSTKTYKCSADEGGLPYNQIGVSEQDPFNSSYIYRVTPAFAKKYEVYSAPSGGGTLLTTTYFTLSDNGVINICNTQACSTPRLTDNAVAVIVSRGKNWALTPSTDEAANTDSNTNFVSHDFMQDSFDDLVIWISPNTLFNRMVAAGKLP